MDNTIILETAEGRPVRKEAVAAVAITPGELIESRNNSGTEEFGPHDTANGTAQPMFALENDLVGDDIDDDYDAGDTVQAGVFGPGDRVQAWLAYGENVAVGDFLTSDGAGALHAAAGSADKRIVAKAKESIDNTSGGARVRIEVEVL